MYQKKQKQYYYATKGKSSIHAHHRHHDVVREKADVISLSQEKQQEQPAIKMLSYFSFAL